MGADNDIVERLQSAGHFYAPPHDAILYEAAAEIVRLRGEVAMTEQQKADRDLLLTGTSFMRDGKRIDPATVRIETPAPAMPNGVDSVAYLLDELRFSRRGYFTSQRRGELADKLEAAIAADFDRLRAADNRDAAGVSVRDPLTEDEQVLHDAALDSMNDWMLGNQQPEGGELPPGCITINDYIAECEKDPEMKAALDAVRARRPRRNLDSLFAEAERKYPGINARIDARVAELKAEMDATPAAVPAGEVVAPLGYVRRKAISAMREDDDVTGIMVHIEAPSDSVPVYLHPPAPVQAAPQEGEAQRHAANEWADMAINGVQWLRNIRDGISTADEALAEMESNLLRVRALNDAARMAAHPSACELGAVRELAREMRHVAAADLANEPGSPAMRDALQEYADRICVALQHRGDSRGGEGSGG